MTTQISKGLIGKEDFNFNTSELYPTETFSRIGNLATTTMTKTPTIYKSHYSIVNACHFNSAAKNDTTLTQALSYIGSNYRTLYIEPGSWTISNNLTISANIRLLVDIGATITVASGKTLTINGYVIAGPYPIFAGTGTVTINTYPKEQAWTTGSTQKLTGIFAGSAGGSYINEFSTDGTLGGNSDLACPTEKAVKAYVDTAAGGLDVATDPIWDAAGDLVQGTGANTAARLALGGALALPRVNAAGNAIEWGTGGQIAFPATAVPSADANTLDDYEEGTYTATLTCGTSGTITLTSTRDLLAYTKIGRSVSITGSIRVNSVSSPVGNLVLNLPFALGTLAETSEEISGSVSYGAIIALGAAGALGLYANTGSSINILEQTTTTWLFDVANHIQATTELVFSFTYFTA